MTYLDRLLGLAVVLLIAAVVLPPAVPAIINLAIVGTVCFVIVRIVYYYTSRW